MSQKESSQSDRPADSQRNKVLVCYGLFGLFFLFYIGAAVIQTPSCKTIASLPVLGMPFGLLLSLAIFPVSWLIIFIWFKKAR